MPIDFTFSEPARFELRASGEVTLAEIESMSANLMAHPGMADGVDMLIVTDEVGSVPSSNELRVVAREIMSPMLKRGLGALAIVAPNPFVYGVARVFGVFAETVGGDVGTFKDVDGARHWLTERRRSDTTDR